VEDIFLIVLYLAMVVPSLLLVKETKTRIMNLKAGVRSLVFLPLTIGGLVAYVLFAMDHVSSIPILNWSWLGYNIALGPFADSDSYLGTLPFIPLLVYMLVHVNYFEEMYFRKNVVMVVVWAFLHVAMGVAVHVALALLPLGFLYYRIYKKHGVNQAYALHFVTNTVLVALSVGSYLLPL
jgi:hypothetical protein